MAGACGGHLWGKLAGESAWRHAARVSLANLAGHDYSGLARYLASNSTMADLVILKCPPNRVCNLMGPASACHCRHLRIIALLDG